MRSRSYPAGFPNLPQHRQEKVRLGNALAYAALQIAKAQEKAGHCWQLEQPEQSLMMLLPEWLEFIVRPTVFWAVASVCAWGAPWMKPTAIIANSASILRMHRGCPGCSSHIPFVGYAPDGRNWTAIAGPYWRQR